MASWTLRTVFCPSIYTLIRDACLRLSWVVITTDLEGCRSWPGFRACCLPESLQPSNGFAGTFSARELTGPVKESIQYAELFSVASSLALYGPYLRNRHVLVRTDNSTDVNIINRQSTRAPSLDALLRAIYSTCATYNIGLRAEHVSGAYNAIAYCLSRPLLHAFRARIMHENTTTHMTIHHIRSSSYSWPRKAHEPAGFSLSLS